MTRLERSFSKKEQDETGKDSGLFFCGEIEKNLEKFNTECYNSSVCDKGPDCARTEEETQNVEDSKA